MKKLNITPAQKKYFLIGSAIIIAVMLASKFIHSLPKPLPADLQSDNLDRSKILKKGSYGAEVSELQRILLKDYGASLGTSGINKNGIDGSFGQLTLVALMKAKGVSEITLNQILEQNG